jgi:hypothetical protein
MKRKFYISLVLSYLLLQISAFGQGYIINVATDDSDSSVVKIIEDAGFTVLRGDWTHILTQEKLDSVDDADLIIISRNASTWDHGEPGADPGIVEQWADVIAPIIIFSPWMLRNSRWCGFNSTSLSCHGNDSIAIPEDAMEHPIYNGVDVSSGFLMVLDTPRTRNEKFTGDVDPGYSEVLATDPTDDGIIAAEWFAGTPYYDGTVTPQSDRLYLGFVTEGDNCPRGDNIMSAFNGNDDGKKILLNAVAYMQGLSSVPEPIADKNKISVFPNPATDMLTVQGLKTMVNFEIINVTGAVVLSGVTNERINISELQSGIYVLRTDADQWVKFIKK